MPTRNLECDLVWNESLCRSNQGEELDVRSPGSGWALHPTSHPPGGGREKRRQMQGRPVRQRHRRGCGHSQEPRSHRKWETRKDLPGPWGPPRASHPDASASPSPHQTDRSAVTRGFRVVKSWPVQDVWLPVMVLPLPRAHQLPGASLLAMGHRPGKDPSISLWAPLPLPRRMEAQDGQTSGRLLSLCGAHLPACLPPAASWASSGLPDTWSPGTQPGSGFQPALTSPGS